MTLNDVVIRVKERSHRGDINVTTDDITAAIIRAVNDSRREFIRVVPKKWLRSSATITTSSGTSTYSLPSDCQEPLLYRYTTSGADYFINKVASEREFYLNIYGSTVANNKPLYCIDVGTSAGLKQVLFFPTPDATYSVSLVYYSDPTLVDFSTSDLSTTITSIPSYVQDQLWKGALYHYLKSFDDPGQIIAKQDYDQAKLEADVADDKDLDSDVQFRMDTGLRVTDFRSPGTGIRLK